MLHRGKYFKVLGSVQGQSKEDKEWKDKKWKTIFTNHVSDEDIQLKLYLKSNLQFSNEKTNTNLKMG